MLRGSAQDHGALAISITNPGSAAVRVVYLETLPWIVYLYLHTLELTIDGVPRGRSLLLFVYLAYC